MFLPLNDYQYQTSNLINLGTILPTEYSPLVKGGWGGFEGLKTDPNKIPQAWGKWRLGLAKYAFSMALGLSSAIAFSGNCALAQVTSDGTVGTTVNASLLPCTAATCTIGGGTLAGNNLFHSFSSFSILPGGTADFVNSPVINTLVRVTGGNISDIQGLIRAQSTDNFFLINPAGIIFGPGASLDISGSFVGTTADGIRFPGGGEFSLTSAVAPNNPLLTVNPSALFFNQTPAGATTNSFLFNQTPVSSNQTSAGTITNQSMVGLDVNTGQNLFLVGGNVNFDGGVVRAPGGRIELGGLAAPGEVEIVDNPDGSNPSLSFPGVRLSFPDDVARADVLIDNNAIVDVVANNGGDIIINAGNINVLGSSQVCAGLGTPSTCDTPGNFAGGADRQAGNILFDATGTVSISESSRIENDLNPDATGNSEDIFDALERRNLFGSIIIRADSVSITGESQVSTSTFGQGSAGVVFLDVDGGVFIDNSAIFSTVERGAVGNAGGIFIEAGSLSMSNLAELQTLIRGQSDDGQPGGSGEAGSVFIEAKEFVSLSNKSGIFSTIGEGADGRSFNNQFAGNLFGNDSDIVGSIFIEPGSLSLANDSVLNSSTRGAGNAGAVLVIANGAVSITNGSDILSRVEEGAIGDAGGVFLVAESLSIDTFSGVSTSTFGDGDAGLILIITDKDVSITNNSAIFSQAGADSGESGGIGISARSFLIKDNSELNVDNSGLNEAGAILINAREDIILLNGSVIRATASSGNGGDVELNSGDFVLVLGQSDIFTSSGGSFLPGTGGNVDINTKFVIAAPFNDNNIAARAFGGDGGRIQITANRIFDIQERPLVFPTNDISASSPFGFGRDGIVTTNVVNIDPTSGFTNLPTNTVDPTTLIAETCVPSSSIAERQKNQFIITGQGGLPPDPNAAFPGEAVVNDWETPSEEVEDSTEDSSAVSPTPVATTVPQSPNFIEAQGWVYGENGEVIFTAQAPTVTPTTLVPRASSTCNEN